VPFAETIDRDRPAAPQVSRGRVAGVLRAAPGALRAAAGAVGRRPPVFTVGLIACIVATYSRLEVGGRLPMLTYDSYAYSPRGLVEGHFSTLLTSTILTNYPFMVLSICVSLLVTLGTYEVMAGHLRAAAVAVLGAVLGPAALTGGLGLLFWLGSRWADTRLGTLDIGASAIIAMSSGAIAGVVRYRRLTVGLVLFLVSGLLIHHRIADWEHLFVFPLGYLFGRLTKTGRVRSPRGRAGRVITYLVAAVVVSSLTVGLGYRAVPTPSTMHNVAGQVLSPARIVDTTYPSPALGLRRRVEVLLPAGYDSTSARYPVVELLHGYPGRPDDFFSLGDVQGAAAQPGVAPFIAVVPDGNGPRIDDSWFADVPGQKMGTATSTDLRAWVAATFRTTKSWSYAGLSSGGFGAAYLPLIDRQPVHAVCGMSGYYNAADVTILRYAGAAAQRRASPIDHLARAPRVVFLAYGRSDRRTELQTVRYAALLRRHHHVVVRTYPGRHQWAVWNPALRDCFRTILPATGGSS
jgi:S-formylglutathione hydrolase FrmB